jgi:hypothetical protein
VVSWNAKTTREALSRWAIDIALNSSNAERNLKSSARNPARNSASTGERCQQLFILVMFQGKPS